MKRKMELIRKILITIEESDITQGTIHLKFEEYPDDEVSYHVMILAEEGLIDAMNCSSQKNFSWKAKCLTWDGHDVIEAIRDDGRWEKVKDLVKRASKVLTIETMKEAVKELFL